MSGWPHKDFALRIDDADDGLPVVTLHHKQGEVKVLVENHRSGQSYEIDLEVKS